MEEETKTNPAADETQTPVEHAPAATEMQPQAAYAPAVTGRKKGFGLKENPTRYITTAAMITALAFVVMFMLRIKAGVFTYDAKDVVIAVGGFMFGPLMAIIASVLVPLIEMVSVSDTLFWGMLMNIISSLAFTLTASLIYKKNRSLMGAVIALGAAVVVTTLVMIPANILIIPVYMEGRVSTEAVIKLLIPTIIPFNLLKSVINATVIMILYKPLVRAMRHANMLPVDVKASGHRAFGTTDIIVIGASVAVMAVAIVLAILKKW